MIDLQQLKILAQLVDNMEVLANRFEKAYNENDAENWNMVKSEIVNIQNKILAIMSR